MSCLVPGCRSNYLGEDTSTSIFNFPKDERLREQWFRAIPRPRKDYEDNKHMKVFNWNFHILISYTQFNFYIYVCIHHFREGDIERSHQYFDGQRTMTVPRDRVALKKGAVPSIFTYCPSYLSDSNSKPKTFKR